MWTWSRLSSRSLALSTSHWGPAMSEPAAPQHAVDLWQMLPRHNRRTDITGDLRRFIGCLQAVTDLVTHRIDAMHAEFNPLTAGVEQVDLMLKDLGNPFGPMVPEQEAKRLALVLGQIYRQKGTAKVSQRNPPVLGIEVQQIYCSNTVDANDETRIGRCR